MAGTHIDLPLQFIFAFTKRLHRSGSDYARKNVIDFIGLDPPAFTQLWWCTKLRSHYFTVCHICRRLRNNEYVKWRGSEGRQKINRFNFLLSRISSFIRVFRHLIISHCLCLLGKERVRLFSKLAKNLLDLVFSSETDEFLPYLDYFLNQLRNVIEPSKRGTALEFLTCLFLVLVGKRNEFEQKFGGL